MINRCPKTENCPLFNKKLLKRESSYTAYKNLYCCTKERFKECKRYIISNELGHCADFVMPNSSYSIEEIITKMNIQAV
jgi:hypothetical protein